MEVSNNFYKNLLFLKDLLAETYNLNKVYTKEQTLNESFKITISEEDLRKEIDLTQLLEQCLNFSQLKSWFDKLQRPDKDSQISYSLPGYLSGFISIKIYESDLFHLTAHFKLSKNLTNTFILMSIFSFWFERPSDLNSLNLDYINSIYHDLILGDKIGRKLRLLDYKQVSLFDIDKYNPKVYYNKKITNEWLAIRPLFVITNGLELLNANPFKLIDDLIRHLNEIDKFVKDSLELELNKPEQFFYSLSSELKDFLIKGRELFQTAKDTLEHISKPEKKIKQDVTIIKTDKKKSHSLTPKLLRSMFEETFENDKEKGTPIEDCGFRSLSDLHKKYKEQYQFSRQTYYNCFARSNLENILEKRGRNEIGGGFEYRIRKRGGISEIDKEDLNEVIMREKMLVEKAIIHYNRGEINLSISTFEDVLSSPSEQFQNKEFLYYGSKFYLGKGYYKINNYQKALEIFKDIHDENDNLIEIGHYIIKIYLILHNYDELMAVLKFSVKKFEEIFKKYDIKYQRPLNLQKIKEGDDLTNFVLFLNTDKIERRINKGLLQDQGLNFYTKNDIASWKLKKIFKFLINTELEIRRRKIFRIVLENNLTDVKRCIDEFLTLLKNENYRDYFLEKRYILLYLHYFKQLIQSHFENYDFNDFNSKIEKIFPRFSSLEYPFLSDIFRESLFSNKQKTLKFINEINKLRYRLDLYEEPLIHINEKLDFKDPEFISEYIYTEAFYPYKNNIIVQITELIRETMQSEEYNGTDIDNLYNLWLRFYLPLMTYARPNTLLDCITNAVAQCKKGNLEDMIPPLRKLYKNLEKASNPLQKLRIRAKKHVLNKIFQIISQDYPFQGREKISLKFTTEPIKKGEEKLIRLLLESGEQRELAYYDVIYPKVEDLIENKENFELQLILPSEEFANEVSRYLESISKIRRYKIFDLLVLKRISKTIISITDEKLFLYNDKDKFEDNLDMILYKFLELLRVNYNKLIIKTKSFKKESFFVDFKENIQRDLQNEYFDILIEKSPKIDEISFSLAEKNE